jgi:uncharacterized protein
MSEIEYGMRLNIEKKIAQIEQDYQIKIILAIESGSRAWGFESIDSDYDVRFIYKNNPDWYIQVLPKRDVIELPINAIDDYSGWDIKKSLILLNKSNPVLFEWLKSPIIYKKNDRDLNLLLDAANKYFNPISSIYHYLSMAKTNFREYLKSDLVRSKKYFYALRPILSCIWIENNNETPPIEFDILVKQITDKKLLDEINSLLVRKKSGIELGEEKRIDCINSFIESNIIKFEKSVKDYDSSTKPNSDYLDNVLLNIIK